MDTIKKDESWSSIKSVAMQKFIFKSLLKNLLWIFPVSILLFKNSFFLGLSFLCFVISFTYWEYEKFKLPKKLKLHVSTELIKWGYNVAVWGFMILTAYTVGMGIKNNYITDSSTEWVFAVGYSIAFAALLLTLTYMIKTGKNWIMLTCLYLLFDIPGAMPFNYLFFYEKLKVQNGLNEDIKTIDDLRIDLGNYSKPKKSIVESKLTTLTTIKAIKIERARQNAQISRDLDLNRIKPSGITNTDRIDRDIAALSADTNKFNKIDRIDAMWSSQIISPNASREQQIKSMSVIKTDLGNVFSNLPVDSASIEYSDLKIKIDGLKSKNKTQIEGIQDLFEFIADLFGIKKSNTLTDGDKKFIKMSLLPSVIIDLLPLLFSIVYAKWNNQKETIEK